MDVDMELEMYKVRISGLYKELHLNIYDYGKERN
jgi:hypothetical protein